MRPSHSHIGWFLVEGTERKSFKEKLWQTSCCVCCVCFLHVKCEGKDSLHLCFSIGISLGPLVLLHCTQQAYVSSLPVKHGADPQSLASQQWRYALHMSLSQAALKRRGGSDSRTLIVICSFSCVCFWQFMLSLRQSTAQSVTRSVWSWDWVLQFSRGCYP